jgi:chemotaxis protein methyltransferase CheR
VNTLAELAALIGKQSGIRLGAAQMGSVAAAVERLGDGDPAALLRRVRGEGGDLLLQRLIGEVTVKETSFLRDAGQLATIDWPSLLEGARRRGAQNARIWSAACSTGEEPYTLAVLAAEALGASGPPVEILGTDIATAALDEARSGRYDPRALRNLDARLADRHFSVEAGRHVVAPHLREMVSFRQHNLAQDTAPPSGEAVFDLILCRNVLIYFDRRVVDRVVAGLSRALAPGGTLVLGTADRLCIARPAIRPIASPSARSERIAGGGRGTGGASEALRDEEPLAAAVRLADTGRFQEARDAVAAAVQDDPMNAAAHFIRGTVELAGGDPEAAVTAFRRALYVDGDFGPAAFQLGRAYDALDREPAARAAYQRALRTFDPASTRHAGLLGHVDIGDLAAACRVRLQRDGIGGASLE